MGDLNELAEIARGLTKAQRAAILGKRSLTWSGGIWPLRHALIGKGLIAGLSPALTPLGQQVASHLRKEGGAS